jgi:adenylate cyclase class 2
VREELETVVSDRGAMLQILARLGYVPAWRYEKYRTEFRGSGAGLALLDETPFGVFLELEGPAEWIDETAAALGFQPSDYLLESYGALYAEHCRLTGATPGEMVFPPTK